MQSKGLLWFLVALASIGWLSFSCVRKNEARLSVDIPVEGDKMVQVFSLTARAHVYRDFLRGPLPIDTLPRGIYLVSVMWDRDVVSPGEYRAYGPQAADEQAYYSVQKNIFIDPEQGGAIWLHAPIGMTKEALEERLMDKDRPFSLLASAEGKNARLFEEYEGILRRTEEDFHHKRDSLKVMLYAYNDTGDIENAQRTDRQIRELWQKTVLPQYEKAEKQFLTDHAGSPIVPFILHNRITDAETYRSFRPVIDALPKKHSNLEIIRGLESLSPTESED